MIPDKVKAAWYFDKLLNDVFFEYSEIHDKAIMTKKAKLWLVEPSQIEESKLRIKDFARDKRITRSKLSKLIKNKSGEDDSEIYDVASQFIDRWSKIPDNFFVIYYYVLLKYLPPKVNCAILKDIWCNSRDMYHFRNEVRTAFTYVLPHRHHLMYDDEKAFVDTLPDEVTIYRGMTVKESKSRKYGISWTLDKNIAIYFKDEYTHNFSTHGMEKTIVELRIKKEQIVAYFIAREESEIIFLG